MFIDVEDAYVHIYIYYPRGLIMGFNSADFGVIILNFPWPDLRRHRNYFESNPTDLISED